MLQELTRFDASVEFGGNETTYHITTGSHGKPVARLHKSYPYDDIIHPLTVYTGPNLDQVDGAVSNAGAWLADAPRLGDATRLGRVHSEKGGVIRASIYQVDQVGGPELTGKPVKSSTLTRGPLNFSIGNSYATNFLPISLAFRGAGSEGFDISRPAGVTSRFTAEVHDPALDRRLVFALIVSLNVWESFDYRKIVADFKFNPFRKSGGR